MDSCGQPRWMYMYIHNAHVCSVPPGEWMLHTDAWQTAACQQVQKVIAHEIGHVSTNAQHKIGTRS